MTTTTDTELTTTPSVPASVGAPGPALVDRANLSLWMALGSSVLLVLLLIGALTIKVPYLALEPGSAREVGGLVSVSGAERYPPKGALAFTTVSQREATLADAFRGWIDDDIEVVAKERIFGDQSRAENRRYNAQLMDTSKLAAITVALRRLAYEVDIRTSGTVVRQLVEGAPAAAALEVDDVVVAIDGEPLDHMGELGELLQPGGPGATHTLTVERPAGSDTRIEIPVATIAATDDPTRALIGIVPEERIVDVTFPIDVTIDSGNVGGPSAGLAFTLAILDVLTPGELTGGRKVAVTGTIDFDGNVGPVGGALQKAVAVRNAGYEAFLVPSDEYEIVQRRVGADLRVIAVDTLQEALAALASLGGDLASLGTPGAAPAR